MKTFHTLLLVAALVLAACVSSTPAPVETRSAPRSASSSASSSSESVVAARPGHYIVKRGDTLYRIALENGHDYRDVAAWNGITNPAEIRVGQELRIVPPDSASSAPIAASVPAPEMQGGTRAIIAPRIEVRPLEPAASAPADASRPGSVPTLGEPRGGRLAWSEQAWRELNASAPLARGSEPLPQSPRPASSAPLAQSAPATQSSAPMAQSAPKAADDKAEWAWPSNGRIIAGFNESTNKGLDFGGAIGDPVFAAASGKVIYAGSDLRGYGNLVIIKHGNQYTTVYAHNKEILVKEQQQVQKGQRIAVMGDSDADRPKLHFEMRAEGGKPVDPLKLLPTR